MAKDYVNVRGERREDVKSITQIDTGKRAHVVRLDNGVVLLQSYGSIVAGIDGGRFFRVWGGYSVTTKKHVNAFLTLYGLPAVNKASWEALPIDAGDVAKFERYNHTAGYRSPRSDNNNYCDYEYSY